MKKIIILFIISLNIFHLTGCSYMNIEDSVKENFQKPKNIENNQSKNNSQNGDINNNYPGIGESITWKDYYGQKIQYTLKNVIIGKNLSDLNISINDITDIYKDCFSKNGEVLDDKNQKNILVIADVTIKNINFISYTNGKTSDDINKIYIEDTICNKIDFKNDSSSFNISAAYFSSHGTGEKDYYMFELKQGNQLEVTLAWIVPEDIYINESCFYMIGSSSGTECQYFCLN